MKIGAIAFSRGEGGEPFRFKSGDGWVVTNGHVAVAIADANSIEHLKHDEDLDGNWLADQRIGTKRAKVDRRPFVDRGRRNNFPIMFTKTSTDTICVRIGPAAVALGYMALIEALHPGCGWYVPTKYEVPSRCTVVAVANGEVVGAVMPIMEQQ